MSAESATAVAPAGPDTSGSSSGGRHLGLALFVIAAAQLMVVLDATITNFALPAIQTDLGVSDANLAWIVNSYALAFGGLLLLGGKAGDLFGRRKMFQVGTAVFTLASLLGGLAPNQSLLIGARVLQGVGAAVHHGPPLRSLPHSRLRSSGGTPIALTPLGNAFLIPLAALAVWAEEHLPPHPDRPRHRTLAGQP